MVQRTMKAAAVMTAGRTINTYCRNQTDIALRKLGIPLNTSIGVFYGQCMQKMLTELCKTDCEYAVTIDGDTLFEAWQLHRMLSIVAKEEQIDALAAIQVRRGAKTMLGSNGTNESVGWDGYPIKLKTAHFGLTVIDLEKLRQVPKPWFAAIPNEQGEWEGSKVDDDVHFWVQWELAGNTLYMDPGARIGHLEEMIVHFDETMTPKHAYPADWLEANKNG